MQEVVGLSPIVSTNLQVSRSKKHAISIDIRAGADTIKYMKKIKRVPNKLYSSILNWNLRRLIKQFVFVGIIFAGASAFLWYTKLYMNQDRRFWTAVENSMSTPSVTRTLIQGGTGNQVVQQQQFLFSPNVVSNSKVQYTQKSSTIDTEVETRGVTYLDAQYSMYTKFTTNQKNKDGSAANIDDLLNKWEGTISTGGDTDQARTNYVGELVTLVIFGNFDANYRRDVMHELRANNVYKVDFAGATTDEVNGDTVTMYPVSVGLKKYAELLVNSFRHAGLGDFPQLDPSTYKDDARIPLTIAINKRTNEIVGVSFGSRQEQYESYGVAKTIDRPNAVYGTGELETAVQEKLKDIIQ